MLLPFFAFRTDSMTASIFFRTYRTTVIAQVAVGTDINAVFALPALCTKSGTVRAIFAAVTADRIGAVTAVMAVLTHDIGTIHADTAVGTKFVNTSGALSAVFAHAFSTVDTNIATVFADLCTATTLIAVLTEKVISAFTADIAGGTEFVRAVGAFFITVRTEIRTVLASFAAGTNYTAVRAETAGCTETVRSGTVNAYAAFLAQLSVRAFTALFAAL